MTRCDPSVFRGPSNHSFTDSLIHSLLKAGLQNFYRAHIVPAFLRQKFLELKISFTFETVMSHRSKVELLAKARDVGYRTYLYFIATEDPTFWFKRSVLDKITP